jgi:4-hydroxy-3-polyprenylbenzoate decarboxylase
MDSITMYCRWPFFGILNPRYFEFQRMDKRKLIVGITGASGAIYGKLLLERLQEMTNQVELLGIIFSANAKGVWKYELGEDFIPFASMVRMYNPDNFYAPMASGSSRFDTMIICPCTMGTLGRIASGISSDLMTRAADVMLKERRRLILVPRETPYNLIHLGNMKTLAEAGAVICPATPSFYSKPATPEAVAMTVVERILSLSGLESEGYQWNPEGS